MYLVPGFALRSVFDFAVHLDQSKALQVLVRQGPEFSTSFAQNSLCSLPSIFETAHQTPRQRIKVRDKIADLKRQLQCLGLFDTCPCDATVPRVAQT